MNTRDFIRSLGINTHIDFPGYAPVSSIIRDLNYLGIKNLRDSARFSTTPAKWQTVNVGTGARFCAFIPEGSPADMQTALAVFPTLYRLGLCDYFEGPNEEDDPYAVGDGNSIAIAVAFQKTKMAPFGKQYSRKIVNLSLGAGWTADNDWHGDYDKVGDLTAFCDFGNAHTYPLPTQKTYATINALNALALMAAKKPVITSEIGWAENLGHTQPDIAKKALQAAFSGALLFNPMTYFYSLYDGPEGRFGVMNLDGTAKPVGRAIKNLLAMLQPPLTPMPETAAPVVGVEGALPNDRQAVLDGLDGSHWFALWNDTDAPRAVAVAMTLPAGRSAVVYRPVSGVGPTKETVAQLVISDEVVLVRVR